MRNGTLAIYDSDINYLHHLSEYLRSRDDFPYDIVVYSDLEAFNKSSLSFIDIFLTSDIPEFIKEKDIGDVFYLLTDTNEAFDDYICLSKYQSADIILREIMEHSRNKNGISHLSQKENCTVIGVYSPVGRCGKTSLAISLGTALSRKSSTLLISFDSFSFLNDIVNEGSFRDISDLLFYFKEDASNLKNKLLSLTYNVYELKFICPPLMPDRIKAVDKAMWCELINAICKSGLYSNIVFDISDAFSSMENLFMLCDIIYMPHLQDYASTRKVDYFFDLLSHTNPQLKDRFVKCVLPQPSASMNQAGFMDYISNGEFFSIAKLLIDDELNQEVNYEYSNG